MKTSYKVLKWYAWCLLPFFIFSAFGLYHWYLTKSGQLDDNYLRFSSEELETFGPTLIIVGMIFSGTLIVVVAINHVFDIVHKKLKGDIYNDKH